MSIYLPIAEIPINIFLLMLVGMVGGMMAGLFGIGGGFIVTPILIFLGIPPSVAVATSSNQIVASSVTGFFSHWYRRSVDIKMGAFLMGGGCVGAYMGVLIFSLLKSVGQIDLVISLIYVLFLGSIGGFMFYESSVLMFGKKKRGKNTEPAEMKEINREQFLNLGLITRVQIGFNRLKHYVTKRKLPFVTEFPKSKLKISAFLPLVVGLVAGIMVSLMGIGGGFVLIPAMIYLLKMPSNIVVGTSLFQMIFITSLVTILHAVNTQSVDVVLSLILIFGGVIGTQIGSRMGMKVRAEKLRFLLSILILTLCLMLAANLLIEPKDIYTIEKVVE